MITLNSPIVGGDATEQLDLSGVDLSAVARSDELDNYIIELRRLCRLVGFDWRILFAQAWHETDGFTSYWWRERLNPAGIGITGDPAQNEASHTWQTGTDAARAHVVHMLAYVDRDLPRSKEISDLIDSGIDPRWDAVGDAGLERSVRVLGDLGAGRWATDPDYAAKIAATANRLFTEEPSMGIVATECPIEIWVLDGPSVNRPALAMPDTSFVAVHEVGNRSPGADEDMHARFVHNGGGENAVSFHFVVGPTKAIQLVYLNENAWHASDGYYGRGNRDSWAIETIQIGDKNRTRNHLAWLIAELYRNPRRFAYRADIPTQDDLDPALVKERTKRHYDFAPDKKWCPQDILNDGVWPDLLNAVAAELQDVAPNLPRYTAPVLPEWWSEKALLDMRSHREDGILYQPQGMRLVALKQTGAYADPVGNSKLRTRDDLKVGEAVDLRYRYKHPTDGNMIGITRFGTHIYLKYFDPQVTYRYTAGG